MSVPPHSPWYPAPASRHARTSPPAVVAMPARGHATDSRRKPGPPTTGRWHRVRPCPCCRETTGGAVSRLVTGKDCACQANIGSALPAASNSSQALSQVLAHARCAFSLRCAARWCPAAGARCRCGTPVSHDRHRQAPHRPLQLHSKHASFHECEGIACLHRSALSWKIRLFLKAGKIGQAKRHRAIGLAPRILVQSD